jgi:ubiquinone/menaquinone biosynthesis C-methylase UbiE
MLKSALRAVHGPIYAKRVAVLADMIVSHLRVGNKVLDIGCGSGMLGKAILGHANCPAGISYVGVEKHKRGHEPIEVVELTNDTLPFGDGEFDAVVVADVLHHENDEGFLFDEAVRVSRRYVIVKDHKVSGFMAQWRVSFLDWAANDPYSVECTYRYHTLEEWRSLFRERALKLVEEKTSINLYPFPFNSVFGKALQYFAVLSRV